MPKPKIAFVVGHENWGKSETLRALTNGDRYQKKCEIGGVEFFVRRMSNDDIPETHSFEKFMNSLDPTKNPNIIAALCPNFQDVDRATELVLESLRKKGYQLFFWVMENQYGTDRAIAANDISHLRTVGEVEVVSGMHEANARASNFKRFVTGVVLA
jgi:hypothetical protein